MAPPRSVSPRAPPSTRRARSAQLRKSRVPFLRTIVVPLPPSGLLRAVARWASRGKAQLSSRGAGFKLLYLDDDLRMHKTFDGQYFVQQRCRYWYR